MLFCVLVLALLMYTYTLHIVVYNKKIILNTLYDEIVRVIIMHERKKITQEHAFFS